MLITRDEELLFIEEVLKKVGVSENDASVTANSLTMANLRGVDSHGILRLPIYIKRMQKGLIKAKPAIRIEREDNTSAVVDADDALGQVAGSLAMKLAIEKASTNTIGLVLVKGSNHFGTAAHYSMMASKKGFIGIVGSNTTALMPPTGGIGKVLGNNPLSISAPAGSYGEVTVDMAMSNVAMGKIINYDQQNKEIPLGWGVDRNGDATTNPKDVLNGGFLLPVGGPKGYGLALILEILTGVLTNSPVSKEIKSMYSLEESQKIEHIFMAINVNSLINLESYNERVEQLLDYVKNADKCNGVEEILIPGEIENRCHQKRVNEGINISEELLNELNALAQELGVEPLKGGN